MSEARKKNIRLRVNVEELLRLDRIATHHGLSMSDVLRMLAKHEDDRIKAAKL